MKKHVKNRNNKKFWIIFNIPGYIRKHIRKYKLENNYTNWNIRRECINKFNCNTYYMFRQFEYWIRSNQI